MTSVEKFSRLRDFVVNYISYYSDLVDYVSVIKNNDEDRQNVARSFSKFLLQNKAQMLLAKVGLFPTVLMEEALYGDGYFKFMEESLESLCIVPAIF